MGIENSIIRFVHCSDCYAEVVDGGSPREYVRNEVGITAEGIQVWCIRHEQNVVMLTPERLAEVVAHMPDCAGCGHA